MVPLLILATPILLVIAHDLARRPTIRRLAIRNVARRKGEALLVVAGSLLGTAIITSSFIVGDTLGASVRDVARTDLGPIDEWVRVDDLANLPALEAALNEPIPGTDGTLRVIAGGAAMLGLGD